MLFEVLGTIDDEIPGVRRWSFPPRTRLNHSCIDRFRQTLQRAFVDGAETRKLVIDMANVESISPSIIRELNGAADRNIATVGAEGEVRMLLRILLNREPKIIPNKEESLYPRSGREGPSGPEL